MNNKTMNNLANEYPDGWTCTSCGTEFSEKTINIECFYVINTDERTQCINCVKESEADNE